MSSGIQFPSGTVTMLFTDIEGSTRLLKQLGDRYGELLADHRRLLRGAFAAHDGREMDTQGDAFFFVFARARGAALAAVDGQRALAAHAWPDGVECRVRMGLHTGEPSVGKEGYHGIGLHRGARIAGVARGGQILASTTTAELLQDDLPPGVGLLDLGERPLKDIDRPERLYQLVADGLRSNFPPASTGGKKGAGSRGRLAVWAAAVVAVAVVAVIAVVLETSGGRSTASTAVVASDSVGIFDPASGRITGQVLVGASPGSVTAGGGSIWAANVDAATVSRIDPLKQVVIDTVQVGNGPDGIAFGGGFVWVANGLDGTVTEIDPRVDKPVNTITVGNGPAGIAVGSRYVWVANSSDGTVTWIDLRTDRPLPAIPVSQSADGIAVGFGSVWVTSRAAQDVTRLDEHTGELIQPIQAGAGADAVTTGLDAVWVANSLGGTVTEINPSDNSVHTTVPVGDGPNGLAIADRSVWVINGLEGTLSRIDPDGTAAPDPAVVGNRPEGIVEDSGQLFVAVRASGAGHRGGTLTVLSTLSDSTLDPATGTDYQLASITNDGLTGFQRAGGTAGQQIAADLAVSLPVPTNNGRTYNFQLRPGIHYSNGAPVKPQDFRREIERSFQLTPTAAPYYAVLLGGRKCLAAPTKPCDLSKGIVTKRGSNTISFHLTSPDPDFLTELALPYAYAVPADTPLHVSNSIPATGPYMIGSFNPSRSVRLVRNPKFHEWSPATQPNGFPNTIVERFNDRPGANVAAVLHGTADLAGSGFNVSPAELESLQTRHLSQLKVVPWASTFAIALNTQVAPFDNLSARQAVSFAVDRGRLTDLTLGPGLGTLTCQILPSGFEGFERYCPYTAEPTPSGTWSAPDLQRAQQLVRSSGTQGAKVTLWIPSFGPFSVAAAKYVVSVLDSLGYNAGFRHVGEFTKKDATRFQAGFFGWQPDFATPSGFITSGLACTVPFEIQGEPTNISRFCSPSIDREMARAQSLETSDPQAALALWARIDREITEQAPWVSYANGLIVQLLSHRVRNFQYNPQYETLLDQLWVR